MLEISHDMNWEVADKLKLFNDSKMQSFMWRSKHGTLYARKDLKRFQYIQEQNCEQCIAPIQNVIHVYTECPRYQLLFANLEQHLKLTEKFSYAEKLVGIDSGMHRTKLQLKKLNILRKCMYDAVHAGATLRWEEMLSCVENLYVIEYAIADKNNSLLKHFKSWEI